MSKQGVWISGYQPLVHENLFLGRERFLTALNGF